MCGYPKCSNFTKAAIVGLVEIDACPVLKLSSFQEVRQKLCDLVSKKAGLRFKTATELPEGGVLLTRPCKDTDQKVMAELRIHNGVKPGERVVFGVFDPSLLCDLSECLKQEFEAVKCSKDLGYGRADTGEMSITILQDGRVNMRRVDNKEQVLKVFAKIERVILGSTICNCCGNDLISIASGLVEHNHRHTVLDCGSMAKIDCDLLKPKLTKSLVKDIFGSMELLDELDSLAMAFLNVLDKPLEIHKLIIPEVSSDLMCRIVSLVDENGSNAKMALLLRLLGFEWILRSTSNAIEKVHQLAQGLHGEKLKQVNVLLDAVRTGKSSQPPSLDDDVLFRAFALSKCLVRGLDAITDWLSES